jgi:hypothetical protein
MFWIGLFITDITVIIWQNMVNMGSILSLASVLIILIMKMGKDE